MIQTSSRHGSDIIETTSKHHSDITQTSVIHHSDVSWATQKRQQHQKTAQNLGDMIQTSF